MVGQQQFWLNEILKVSNFIFFNFRDKDFGIIPTKKNKTKPIDQTISLNSATEQVVSDQR